MKKEIIRNILITILILVFSNFLIVNIFTFNYRPAAENLGAGASYSDTEASAVEKQVDFYVPTVIIINFSIILLGSLSVSKYLFRSQHFPRIRKSPMKPEMTPKRLKSSKMIIADEISNKDILSVIEGYPIKNSINSTNISYLTSVKDDILKKIDNFDWQNEREKVQFIKEILALTPEEREDIIDYMLKKSKKNELIE